MGLWVLILTRCSTITILFDVGHITHSCKPTLPSSLSTSIHHAPPSSGSSYFVCIAVPAQGATCCLYCRCGFLRNDRLPWSHPSSNRGSDTTVGSRGGARGTVHIEARTTTLARETPHSYPKP
ncbi:hypothetical protein MTR_2g437510 [Medicago truncatula]|uniref:Transmembrane protein n=1 Tax=Medicago truncatula TaxID=3880 RepID=A0A072V5N9_MEDTR|nr:hypothetical protein MTR_2g437510 [Medicago truncatula]